MKRSAICMVLLFVCLSATAKGFGQKSCEFNILGTWKATGSAVAESTLYRFTPDGRVTALAAGQNSPAQEVATATYRLDNPQAPKTITFGADKESGGFTPGLIAMEITGYDDTSFTTIKPDAGLTRWVRVDASRYFMVLAGRTGMFYDRSGPSFSMLIKMDGGQAQVEALGIYATNGIRMFGPVPAATYNQFMNEPRADTDVMLRLEMTAAQYERGMKIMTTWERRVREGALLYPDIALDNVLLVKQVTETLNQCSAKIKLYNLDWGVDDQLSDTNRPPHIPFKYFKELRRLNEALHVRDEQFYESRQPAQHRAGQ